MSKGDQMNNKVIFAAAGNGKTYSLCLKAREVLNSQNKYVLLISYTHEGVRALENEYKKQNKGILDNRVIIKSWYSFILSELIKPYQCLLELKKKNYKEEKQFEIPENFISSIAFYNTGDPSRYYTHDHVQYFFNNNNDIFPNRASYLAYLCNEHSKGKAIKRMEHIYSHVLIDELQDYAGWDLELISLMFNSQMQVTCVGDYKQATFNTHIEQKNKQFKNEGIINYFKNLEKKKICSIIYENTTRRFNQEICDFINLIYGGSTAEVISEQKTNNSNIIFNTGVYIIDTKDMPLYCEYYNPVILRYDKRSKLGFLHRCEVCNYGSTKGATYERVVIIPVSTVLPFLTKREEITSKVTKAKFYVACTRAKYSIVFAIEKPSTYVGFKPFLLKIGDKLISAFKYEKIFC